MFQIKQTVNQLDAEQEQNQDAARAKSVLDAFAEEVRPREGTKTYGEWRTEENSRADGQRKEEKGMRGKDTKRVGRQKRIEEARIAEEERREEMKREEKKGS